MIKWYDKKEQKLNIKNIIGIAIDKIISKSKLFPPFFV